MKKIFSILLLLLLSANLVFSADYADHPKINELTDVSAAITKDTIIPVQDMNDTDKTGGATIQQIVDRGLLRGKRTASAVDYNPSALTTDSIIAITNTDAARSVILSSEDVASGTTDNPRVFRVVDESLGAAAHNITITLEGGGTISGAASFIINQNGQTQDLYATGTNAFLF